MMEILVFVIAFLMIDKTLIFNDKSKKTSNDDYLKKIIKNRFY